MVSLHFKFENTCHGAPGIVKNAEPCVQGSVQNLITALTASAPTFSVRQLPGLDPFGQVGLDICVNSIGVRCPRAGEAWLCESSALSRLRTHTIQINITY